MHKNWHGSNAKIGVLGGGQLGRMLLQSAIDFNLQLHFLDADPDAPCALIGHSFTCGSITDFDTVYAFGKDKDLLTVEIENVSIEALEQLEKEGVLVYPQPAVLRVIKDKGTQKQFYFDHQLPTAPFHLVENRVEASRFPAPFVHKMRTGGYDGKGVQVIKNESDKINCFDEPSVVETLVPFVKELSVIVARNASGETKAFPVVECEFNPEANLVEFLFSPAEISREIEEQAEQLAIQVIEKLNMVGILAVELFLTADKLLLINEIAPRPHNSGHHTIECNVSSQFEQHLRSILNWPLGDTSIIRAGAMLNILGEKGHTGIAKYEGLEIVMALPETHVHLYGKQATKPFRKMGHLTITGATINAVREKVDVIKNSLKVVS